MSAARGVAEVKHDRALLLIALRFQEQRQAPLVVQDVAGIRAATRPRALMHDAFDRAAAQELIVRLIDQHPHRQLVDGRNLDRLRARDLDAAEAADCGGCRERGRSFQKIAPFETVHVVLPVPKR